MIMIIFWTNFWNTNTRITLPASSYLPSKKPTGAPSFIQWHRPCVKCCCEIYNQYFKTIYNDGDHCRSCVERLQSNFVLVWFLHFIYFMIIYSNLSRKPREYPCKFFLAGVNFYTFNAKNWHFRQILSEKVVFFLQI